MSSKERESRYINKSLKKAFSVLDMFDSERVKLSATDIADELGVTQSSLFPILYTLEEFGYIYRDENKKYSLGLRFLEKGNIILQNMDLRSTAKPFLKDMAKSLQGNAHLAMLHGNDVMYLEREEGHMSVSINNIIGRKVPVYCTALGKVLLANTSESKLESYLEGANLEPYTQNTITDKDELQDELHKVRSRGYAIDNEEFQQGSLCVAAPVRDYTGTTLSAISISLSKSDYPDLDLTRPTSKVTEIAEKISQELGGSMYQDDHFFVEAS